MNTFEEYVEKFINLTENNEIIWNRTHGVHHSFGVAYKCEYKNTPIVVERLTAFNVTVVNLKINDIKKSDINESDNLENSKLYKLVIAISKQISNRNDVKMMKELSKLDD